MFGFGAKQGTAKTAVEFCDSCATVTDARSRADQLREASRDQVFAATLLPR